MKKIILTAMACLVALVGRAQYEQFKLDTICYAGPSDVYTDIIFLGDGFKQEELPTFVSFVHTQADAFFGKVPWNQYRNRFNFFYIQTPSNESGAGMTPDAPIDNYYGVCFGTSGVDRMPWPTKWDKVYGVLNAVKPDYDVVCVVVNSVKYGGGGGGKFLCFSMEKNCTKTLHHEMGHAFGSLMDEYWYRGQEKANMTQTINPVKWQRWMGYNEVGTYRYSDDATEEAYTWYRPHQNCQMRFLSTEYCPVCCEALIEKIHETSSDIASYSPTNEDVSVGEQRCQFALELLKPEPNTLRTEWMVDGEPIAHNMDQLMLSAADLPAGRHQLTVMVEDTTTQVRTENHSDVHSSTITWQLDVEESTGIQVASAQENRFQVGPLPFTTALTFRSLGADAMPICMELYDMSGRQVAKEDFTAATSHTLNTATLSPGHYILRVYQGQQLLYVRKVRRG